MLAAFPIDRARLQRPGTGMEGATLILMELTHNQRVFKSVDLLELFMEHLSWYERDLRFFRAADVVVASNDAGGAAQAIRMALALASPVR